MNGVLDQGDDSEFTLDDTKVTLAGYEKYVNLMGWTTSSGTRAHGGTAVRHEEEGGSFATLSLCRLWRCGSPSPRRT